MLYGYQTISILRYKMDPSKVKCTQQDVEMNQLEQNNNKPDDEGVDVRDV